MASRAWSSEKASGLINPLALSALFLQKQKIIIGVLDIVEMHLVGNRSCGKHGAVYVFNIANSMVSDTIGMQGARGVGVGWGGGGGGGGGGVAI